MMALSAASSGCLVEPAAVAAKQVEQAAAGHAVVLDAAAFQVKHSNGHHCHRSLLSGVAG